MRRKRKEYINKQEHTFLIESISWLRCPSWRMQSTHIRIFSFSQNAERSEISITFVFFFVFDAYCFMVIRWRACHVIDFEQRQIFRQKVYLLNESIRIALRTLNAIVIVQWSAAEFTEGMATKNQQSGNVQSLIELIATIVALHTVLFLK